MDTGLILVTTGDEGHYSIPAMGQAFRAIGHKMRLCIIEFVPVCGAIGFTRFSNGFRIWWTSTNCRPTGPGRKKPQKAWDKANELIHSGRYQMVVMEGLSSLIDRGMVDPSEIADCLATRPRFVHVIIADVALNGPIIDVVDLVTEMKTV